MNSKREYLLKLFELKKEQIKDFEKNYQGPEWLRRVKRLLKYRQKYLKYLIRKIFSRSTPSKVKTFFEKDFWYRNDFFAEFFGLLSGQEIRLTYFLLKHLPEGSVFYDVGAHMGFYSLLVNELLENKEIHTFEPTPTTFKYLKMNLQNSKSVFLNQVALFDKETEIEFFISKNFKEALTNSFDISKDPNLNPSTYEKIKIRVTTLDKYCLNHSLPTILKIDVEGAEGQIIEGGKALLKRTNPIIAMEVWGPPKDNSSHLKAINTLYHLKYNSYKINENGELVPTKNILSEVKILGFDNFIFKK